MVRLVPDAHDKHPLPNLLGNGRQRRPSVGLIDQGKPRRPSAGSIDPTLQSKDAKSQMPRRNSAPAACDPQSANGDYANPGPPPMSEAERDLMRAIYELDAKKARKLLCQHGGDLLSGHGAGGVTSTAILYAAEAGNEELCELLVAHGGAQVLEKGLDINRLGAADYAEKGGHHQLAAHLKAMEARVRNPRLWKKG